MAKTDLSLAQRNQLLACVDAPRLSELLPELRRVNLKVEQVIHQAEQLIEEAYFPLDCIVSAVNIMENGAAIEVASIGKEGAVGLLAFCGRTSPNRNFIQVAGEALKIDAQRLDDFLRLNEGVRQVFMRYHSAFLSQVSHSVACNGLHTLPQRCARWLLITRDRTESDKMPLTHEFLSMMLGVRRAGVTEALQMLRDAGAISYTRGAIHVEDRRRLEKAACECYGRVKRIYDKMLSGDGQPR